MYNGALVRKLVLAILIGMIAGLELTAGASQPQPTFKAAVDVVPISAVVRDSRGRLVTTLTAMDFEILDKGERRNILDFQVDDTSPITIAVLVDVSGSMRMGPQLAFSREILSHLTDGLREGRDEVGLFTFDAVLREEQPFTTYPGSLDAILAAAEPFGSTALYDAIAETALRIKERPTRRRAIVVLTDGVDTSSVLTPAEVSGLASSIDVPVYVVAAVPSMALASHSARAQQSSADLRELARWTGGELLWVSAQAEAAQRAGQILSELRHQYLIAIESAALSEWRPIDVRVRNHRLTVRARSGYFSRNSPITR